MGWQSGWGIVCVLSVGVGVRGKKKLFGKNCLLRLM